MDTVNYSEMARQWADIVIERWIRKIRELHIGSTGELVKSLEAQVAVDSNGNPAKITFLYLYYGRFVDMGVGRGVKLGIKSETRERKPWYSSVFMKQVAVLGRKMAEKYGYDVASLPLRAFENISEMAFNDEAYHNLSR